MRGPTARILGIALAAAGIAAAAPASAERYEDGLAAYNRNDYTKSLKLLRAAAEKGDERAQYLLGRHYQFGQGVKADRAEAFFWYKRAEAKGHLEAKLFRQLLEKRWKITGDEKGRAERKLTAMNAPPKPPPAIAETAQKIKPESAKPEPVKSEKAKAEKAKPEKAKPEKPIETAALKEKAKPAPAERAKPESAASKPKAETLRARLQEAPRQEAAKPAPAEKPAMMAARNTPESEEPPSAILRGTTSTARLPARASVHDDDDDGEEPRYSAPPAETRTTVAAVPPPPSDYDAYRYPPSYAPSQPNYPPPSPYYAPGPAPYYAPPWRASIYYGPRPHYQRPWGGYRAHVGYMHPGWRGFRRWWSTDFGATRLRCVPDHCRDYGCAAEWLRDEARRACNRGPASPLHRKRTNSMKTILAIAAVVGFAIAAPSLALAHGGEKHAGVKTPPVKKQLVVKPGKLKLTAKLACAKPIIVKGVKQCPTEKGAPATK